MHFPQDLIRSRVWQNAALICNAQGDIPSASYNDLRLILSPDWNNSLRTIRTFQHVKLTWNCWLVNWLPVRSDKYSNSCEILALILCQALTSGYSTSTSVWILPPPSWSGSYHHHSLVTISDQCVTSYYPHHTRMCQEHRRDTGTGDVSQVVRVCQLSALCPTLGHKNSASHRVPVPQAIRASHTAHHTPGGKIQLSISLLLSALYLLSDPTQSTHTNLQPTNLMINSTNFLRVCLQKIFRMNKF